MKEAIEEAINRSAHDFAEKSGEAQGKVDALVGNIITSSDSEKRGLPNPRFRIVCECGSRRDFIFYERGFDVLPCPVCGEHGVSNK